MKKRQRPFGDNDVAKCVDKHALISSSLLCFAFVICREQKGLEESEDKQADLQKLADQSRTLKDEVDILR